MLSVVSVGWIGFVSVFVCAWYYLMDGIGKSIRIDIYT